MPAHDAFICHRLDGLYFAYGSNLDLEQMKARCSRPVVVGIAALPDHRMEFFGYCREWDGGLEGLVPAPGQVVWGVLYRLSTSDWDRLDAWQGVRLNGTGDYFHYPVKPVDADGKIRPCLLHQKDAHREPRPPSREYLERILRGAEQQGLPVSYIASLQARTCVPAAFPVPVRRRFDRGLLADIACSQCGT